MSARISSSFFTVIILLLPLLLAACSASVPVKRSADLQMQQLVTGVDRCLAAQAGATEQLQRQEQQLQRQAGQLEAISDGLQAAAAADAGIVTEPAGGACEQPGVSPKLLVGQLEEVWLQNLQLSLPARIDTGAETASLDARNIEIFERDGRRWVRFEIVHPDTAEPLPLERKLNRMVAIIQSNSDEAERRPVIKLGITIGHISQTAEFTLSNRSHLGYQVLIGRNILQDVMVVDVSQKNIAPYVVPNGVDDRAGAAQ